MALTPTLYSFDTELADRTAACPSRSEGFPHRRAVRGTSWFLAESRGS